MSPHQERGLAAVEENHGEAEGKIDETTVGLEPVPNKLLVDRAGGAYVLDVSVPTFTGMAKKYGWAEIRLPGRGSGERSHVRYSVAELGAWARAGGPPARTWKRAWAKLRATGGVA